MEFVKEYVFHDAVPFGSCHSSTLLRLDDGSFLSAWFGGSKEGAGDVAIWFARKAGAWSAPVKVADEEGLPHWNPVLFRAPGGRIFLYYKAGDTIPAWHTRVIHSDDAGLSWSEPRPLVEGDSGGRGPVKNAPIIRKDGVWLAPASVEGDVWDAFVDISRDSGGSWERSGFVPVNRPGKPALSGNGVPVSGFSFKGKGVIQPALWESDPGHVHMLLRSMEGWIIRSDSSDGGETWSPAYKTTLVNNNSGIDLARLDDGRLILAHNPVGENWGKRTPLILSLSEDNGESWSRLAVFEEGEGEYSYPSVIAQGTAVFATYTWNRKRIAFVSLDLA